MKKELLSIGESLKERLVDMNRFIRETPEDVLDELSNYAYQCFNWKGSKFKKEWN